MTTNKHTLSSDGALSATSMLKLSNMYRLSKKQWNLFVGCGFNCTYCKTSFKRQAKRQKQRCLKCWAYTPHEHAKRLSDPLPKTKPGEFIFTCASGDVAFCSTTYLQRIVDRIRSEPDKTFLLQSKNPATFSRVECARNLILGTTIETNRDDLGRAMSNAPAPSERFAALRQINHARKMVTVEPIMEFDLDVMVDWISQIQPEMVWIGYDSKKNNLPEPSHEKVEALGNELKQAGITVIYKTMREARAQV
jgi:DNA repair photolyase